MAAIDCFQKRPDLAANFKSLVDKGMSEKEAASKTILDEHEKLYNDLNEIRGKIDKGLVQPAYQRQDFSAKTNEINDKYSQLKSNQNAVQESGPSSILQHPQEGTGIQGSERGRMEQSQQGETSTQENKNQSEGKVEPLPKDSNEPFGNITRITHAVVDEDREKTGLPEIPKGATKHDVDTLNKALGKIGKGYTLEDMMSEFKDKKSHTDDDTATLLAFKKDREDQLRNYNDAINNAYDKKDESALTENQIKKARVLDDFDKIGQLAKKFGSEAGLTLRAQRLGLNDDYSLAAMISKKRAANGGRPLTDDERSDIEQKFNAIQQKVSDIEKQVKELQSRKPPKSISLKGKELADKIRGLRPQAGTTQANILGLPLAIYDTAIVTVANAVEKGAELIDGIAEGIKYLRAQGFVAKNEDQRQFRQEIYDHVGEGVEFKNILTPESIKGMAAVEREKNNFDAEILKDEKEGLSKFDKTLNTFVDWERAGKLMWPTTLAKLTSAAMTRLVQSPIEDVIGKGIDYTFPSMAQKATGESGFNVKAQAKLVTSAFTQGMKDAADIMSKEGYGKSDIDFAFGGRKTTLPPEAVQFFGQLHSALKAPIKRGIFERSLEKRIANNIKIGNDTDDPNVQMRIATQAYKDANRAIFMQDNKLAGAYQAGVRFLERQGEEGKAAAAIGKFMVPFVKVPTNIVGETITSTPAGLALAGLKFMHTAFTKGVKNMSEDEADMIYRMVKKGSLGSAMMLYGYFHPQNFGGFYQPGKQDPDKLKAGQMKFLGVTLPSWLLHAPIFNVGQLGATMRNVHDKYEAKEEGTGLTNGIWAGALGLANEEPLFKQPLDFSKLGNPSERQYYFGELAKNTVAPGLLQFAAKVERGYNPWTEKTSRPAAPKTIGEHVATGFPGLTELAPNKDVAGAGATYEAPPPKKYK